MADACYHPKEEWRKPDRLRTNEYVNEKHGCRNCKSAIRTAPVGGFSLQKLHCFVGENAAGWQGCVAVIVAMQLVVAVIVATAWEGAGLMYDAHKACGNRRGADHGL